MITGVEINMIVPDCLEAIKVYEAIFEVENIQKTNLKKGSNEVLFSIFDTKFHLLDENPDYMMFAPKAGVTMSSWINVNVSDIQQTFSRATSSGCAVIQPVTEVPMLCLSNALFTDPFGYIWMLHQIHTNLSFDKRLEILEQMTKS